MPWYCPVVKQGEAWSRFWTALVNEARRFELRGQREMPVFFDDFGRADSDDYQMLLREATAHCLAGAIVVQHGHVLEAGSALRESGLPLVALDVDLPPRGVPRVSNDRQSFLNKAIAYFRAKGCRRLAVLAPSDGPSGRTRADLVRADLEAAGFECPSRWALSGDLSHPWTAQPAVELLMDPSQGFDRMGCWSTMTIWWNTPWQVWCRLA